MNDLQIVITTAVIMIVLFAIISLLCMKKYGRPVRKYDGYLEVLETDVSQIFRVDVRTLPEVLKTQPHAVLKIKKVLE